MNESMNHTLVEHAASLVRQIRTEGLYKTERPIRSPQTALVQIDDGDGGHEVLNLCANNYLGLADHPHLVQAANHALETHGFGMASVRFICGTSDLHITLERRLAEFLGTEAAILYSSCFDANGGLFEVLLGAEDAIISDALNHASIIDGVRLCKAQRFRYANNDMDELEAQLRQAQQARFRLIATDGVFSMDGVVANLPVICDLAERYDALVMVDDSHAVGFMGERGAGAPAHWGVSDRVQILTGTFGKALGGASGGYVAGPAAIVELLRQRSRPYLFSNALAPSICAATLAALDLLAQDPAPIAQVRENAHYFRSRMTQLGFTLAGADHAIIPVMLGDAVLAAEFARRMGEHAVFVTAFSFPVVPRGEARIRTQMSAGHSTEQLDRAIDAFARVGRELEVIA